MSAGSRKRRTRSAGVARRLDACGLAMPSSPGSPFPTLRLNSARPSKRVPPPPIAQPGPAVRLRLTARSPGVLSSSSAAEGGRLTDRMFPCCREQSLKARRRDGMGRGEATHQTWRRNWWWRWQPTPGGGGSGYQGKRRPRYLRGQGTSFCWCLLRCEWCVLLTGNWGGHPLHERWERGPRVLGRANLAAGDGGLGQVPHQGSRKSPHRPVWLSAVAALDATCPDASYKSRGRFVRLGRPLRGRILLFY